MKDGGGSNNQQDIDKHEDLRNNFISFRIRFRSSYFRDISIMRTDGSLLNLCTVSDLAF